MSMAAPSKILTEWFGGSTPAALLFDLDGTLLDSLPDLATAIDRTLLELGYSAVGMPRVRGWIGDGARQLVREALSFAVGASSSPAASASDAMLDEALGIYMRQYAACCTERSQLFAGVRESLSYWAQRGVPMACVTNKAASFTEPLLDHFQLRDWLPVVVSGDTLAQRKPAAAPLLLACRQLAANPSDTLMIGDSRNDVLAARAAAMPVVCVSYGYNHGRSIEAEGPDLIVDSLVDLRSS